ncbi:MAG TPA: polysaccharide deacetylase family protein, partial [Cytophagaceae bacterium]|nr:polysaccharide deacetylase family protein [Cytophagaceae bacterium]
VPFNHNLAVCITHDIDFTRSIMHAVEYARLEKEKGIKATYFIQTKYIKDWNDDVFFNKRGAACTREMAAMGMEIASHSVSHSYVFSKFPMGSGEEKYPSYTPFVVNRDSIRNGTILGELRVSRFLLETVVPQLKVCSFRSGHLSYPFALPQALKATGFQYSSCITANQALTQLPYQLMYDRTYDAEMELFEFPVTIEDEKTPRLDLRLNEALQLAKQLEKDGGFMNILIHTDTLDYKLRFERQLIDSLSGKTWFGTLKEYADWWKARNAVRVEARKENNEYVLTVFAPGKLIGLGFEVPDSWTCLSLDENISRRGNKVLINHFDKKINLRFSTQHP